MRFKSLNVYHDVGTENDRRLTHKIRNDCDHVIALYLEKLKYYDNDNCKSLNIACTDKRTEVVLESLIDGFHVLYIPFELNEYEKLNGEEISRYWLDVITRAVGYAGRQWGWDLERFEKISREVTDSEFVYRKRLGKYVKSPSGKLKAAFTVEQSLSSAKLFLQVMQGRKEYKNLLVCETEPPIWCYLMEIGTIEWIDETHIRIHGVKRTREIVIE